MSLEGNKSSESNISIKYPFQLTEHNYQEQIEFIKNSLLGAEKIEEKTTEDKGSSINEFNANFTSMQSWFIRISHKEKLSFVLKLLEIFSVVLKRSTNLLIDILGPISKDYIYAKTQFTFSKYDMTPLDNNRCLTDIPLAEAKANSMSWFSELEEKEQVRVMIILLNIAGSAITSRFYFKATLYLDHRAGYNKSEIEDKLKEFKFYNNMMRIDELSEFQDFDMTDFIKSDMARRSITHGSTNMSHVNSETKCVVSSKEEGSPCSLTRSKTATGAMDYEQKLLEWEQEFRELINISELLQPENLNEIVPPVIDMVQLLPISVNRYIYRFLDHKSRKQMKHLNKYWLKSAAVITKEEHTRHGLNQTINMLDFKLFKYRTKDLYSEVRYAHPKMRDRDQPASDQENKQKPQSILLDANIRRSSSAPSLIDNSLFIPKYSIKMTPAPNHQYTKKYPKNPYRGRYVVSEICSRFDHTRCIAANYQWIAMSDKTNITLHSALSGAPNPCQLKGHTGYVTVLCFHPSKNCLFSGSCDTTIRYWDIYSRKVITIYSNHKSLITNLNVNENYLASVSMDQTLRIFKIESGCMVWQYLFSCSPVAVSLGKKLEVYLGVEDGSVFKTDLETTPSPVEWEITHAHGDTITCIVFDEPFVITGGGDGFVRVWHFEHFDASALATFDHNRMSVSGIALSFMKVLTTTIDGLLRIWDIYNSRLKRQIVVNIARTPILSMICMEIYDHTKVIINSEDSIKVIEFPFHWLDYTRTCRTKYNKEPKVVRGLKRITTTTPDDVLAGSVSQLRMEQKHRFEKRCRERLLLRHAVLPAVVKPRKGDKVTFKEVSIFSNALPDYNFLLFPRVIPEIPQKKLPYVIKRDIVDGGSKMFNALWKYLPRSTKGVLPGYNPSKRTL